MKSTTSPAKIAANRRNSQLSTGPKTPRGKFWSRRNALKHGVLASPLLIADGADPKDCAAFCGLLENLRRDLSAVGTAQELLVEKFAVCVWRQRRVLACEAQLRDRELMEPSPQAQYLARGLDITSFPGRTDDKQA